MKVGNSLHRSGYHLRCGNSSGEGELSVEEVGVVVFDILVVIEYRRKRRAEEEQIQLPSWLQGSIL